MALVAGSRQQATDSALARSGSSEGGSGSQDAFEALANQLAQQADDSTGRALRSFQGRVDGLAAKIRSNQLSSAGASEALRASLIGSADMRDRLLDLEQCLQARLGEALRQHAQGAGEGAGVSALAAHWRAECQRRRDGVLAASHAFDSQLEALWDEADSLVAA